MRGADTNKVFLIYRYTKAVQALHGIYYFVNVRYKILLLENFSWKLLGFASLNVIPRNPPFGYKRKIFLFYDANIPGPLDIFLPFIHSTDFTRGKKFAQSTLNMKFPPICTDAYLQRKKYVYNINVVTTLMKHQICCTLLPVTEKKLTASTILSRLTTTFCK